MHRYHLGLLVRSRSTWTTRTTRTTPSFGHPSKGGELRYVVEDAECFVLEEWVPANPVPANPVPANPVPANPVSANPVPANPVSANPVPANPVPVNPVPIDPKSENLFEEPQNPGNAQPPNSKNPTTQSPENRNSPPLEGCPQGGVVRTPRRNSRAYFNLPCNPALKAYAKAHRKSYNLSEVLFWNQVKRGKFKGYDFDRQKIIGNYIVDFYCANCGVVVEIDGSSHDYKQVYDAERDAYLQSLELVVIHVPVIEVFKRLKKLMRWLQEHPALACPA